jgi:hypothetical protein
VQNYYLPASASSPKWWKSYTGNADRSCDVWQPLSKTSPIGDGHAIKFCAATTAVN